MDKRIKLKFIYHNMTRSNRAYQMYKNKSTYYNACHIYNANKIIYDSLNQLLIDDLSEKELQEVINYIFHLEKWFIQFDNEKNKIKDIEETFIFQAFDDHIPFPKNFFKIFNL